jgi:hypothetical protein
LTRVLVCGRVLVSKTEEVDMDRMQKVVMLVAVGLMVSGVVFAEEEINVDRMVKAIYKAEGGSRAKKPYGVLSVPCSTKEACERVCRNSVRNNISRWKKAGSHGDFISFMQRRYAPLSDSPLNANWSRNVGKFYAKGN